MQKKSKQTILAFLLIALVSIGLIFLLQRFANPAIETPVSLHPTNDPENGLENTPAVEIPDTPEDLISDNVVIDLSSLSPEERCDRMEEGNGKLNCYDGLILKEVLASNILPACDKLLYSANKQYCQDMFYKKQALLKMDLALCESIQDSIVRQQCQDSLNVTLSVRDNSLENCDNITDPEQKTICLNKVSVKSAILNADISQCSLIEDEALKELCQNKTRQASNEKIYSNAISSQNTTMCSELSDDLKNDCQDEINYNLALQNNNIANCNLVLEQEKRTNCTNNLYNILAKSEKNPEYCQKITDDSMQSTCLRETDSLLLKSAISKNDSGLCSLISDETLAQKCLNAF